MNDLQNYFENNKGRLIHKCMHYFDVYDRYFKRYRDTEVVVLEIGVSHGGSLQMWKNYFGPKAKIYGVDINPECKKFEEENIKIFIGSQTDRKFLQQLKKEIPHLDILIDDGGHTMKQQILTFEELFGHVDANGVYLCEDLHSSYWLTHGGGHRRRGTFVEYSKNFIDHINAYFSEQSSLKVNEFSRTVESLHYYSGMIVIEKREVETPNTRKTGIYSLNNGVEPVENNKERRRRIINFMFLKIINSILRFLNLKGFIWK